MVAHHVLMTFGHGLGNVLIASHLVSQVLEIIVFSLELHTPEANRGAKSMICSTLLLVIIIVYIITYFVMHSG